MSMDNLATDIYKNQLYEKHIENKNWGNGASLTKLKYFKEFLEENQCKTIIDYGCGKSNFKGFLIEKDYHYEVTEYDIGIVGKDILNIKADFTVCVDLLEHIEPECLDNVLRHIQKHTLKGVFFSICKVKSHGSFKDGTNLHRIINDEDWWYSKVLQYFKLEKETLLTKSHIEFLATPNRD